MMSKLQKLSLWLISNDFIFVIQILCAFIWNSIDPDDFDWEKASYSDSEEFTMTDQHHIITDYQQKLEEKILFEMSLIEASEEALEK